MGGRTRALARRAATAPDWQIVLAAVLFAAVCEAVHLSGSPAGGVAPVARSVGTAAAFIVAGLLARRRQPLNRTGALLVLVGFCLLAEDLQSTNADAVYTVGAFFKDASAWALAWLVLAFPSGRLANRRDKLLVAGLAFSVTLLSRGQAGLFRDPCAGEGCPRSLLFIKELPTVNETLDVVAEVAEWGLVLAMVAIVLDRWRRSSRPAQRVLTPFIATAAVLAVASVIELVVPRLSDGHTVTITAVRVSMIVLPFAFFLGVVRLEIARVDLVEAVIRLGARPRLAELRAAVSKALGDPLLAVWRRDPDGSLVDESNQPAQAPPDGATVPLVDAGEQVGVLFHDPVLRQDDRLFGAVTTVLTESLRRERLALESERHARDAAKARERLARAADEERRKIERDLHDGAQQQLVLVQLKLGALRAELEAGATGDEVAALAEDISSDTSAALGQLRDLAQGIYPALLDNEGLEPALRERARVAGLPVRIQSEGIPRLQQEIEIAAYFCCSEALQNAAKHAGEGAQAEIRLRWADGGLEFEVADDGRGYDPETVVASSGLRNMQDRMSALGGTLETTSRPGGGTTVRGSVPVAPPGPSRPAPALSL